MNDNDAFVGQIYLERGNDDSPQTFTRVCEVFGISGLGETNEQVDATTFCSGGFREFIGGLADGEEMTVECNYVMGSSAIAAMIADVKAKAKRNYQIVIGDDSPKEGFEFAAAALGWVLNPSVDDKNTISFTLKISGEVALS